jgi:hypothetical protein
LDNLAELERRRRAADFGSNLGNELGKRTGIENQQAE